jgi:hypothetical protein
VALVALGIGAAGLLGLGLWLDEWWVITGGLVGLVGAAWIATDPRPT